jgi:hypothetical protein
MTSSTDLLKSVSAQEQPASACKPSAAKQPYRAYEVSGEVRRHLEIRLRYPEPAESPSYDTLTNIRHEWRMGQGFTLIYGKTMMVIIKGDNLTALYQAVKDAKAEWIAEFNGEDYDPLTDDTAPFIKSITIHTSRPEDPPPAAKPH